MKVNQDFPEVPGGTLKTEPWHLFIFFGNNKKQKTYLGGFQTYQETEAEIERLRPRAKQMFNDEKAENRFPFVFTTAEGPVGVAPHEEPYGGPWDKR